MLRSSSPPDPYRNAYGCGDACCGHCAACCECSEDEGDHEHEPNGSGCGSLIACQTCRRFPPRSTSSRDIDTEPGEPTAAHIVKTKRGENAAAVVLEARISGTPVEALCGHVWVPSRDPKRLPLCEECKSIYEMYKSFNDGLSDTPAD